MGVNGRSLASGAHTLSYGCEEYFASKLFLFAIETAGRRQYLSWATWPAAISTRGNRQSQVRSRLYRDRSNKKVMAKTSQLTEDKPKPASSHTVALFRV